MNAPTFAVIFLCLLLNPVSKASLLPFMKRGLNELNHFLNIPHPFVSVLFPEPVEAKNITIKLGFIGALDNSLGATASLGEELVSNLLLPITWGLLVTQQFAAFLKLTLIALYFSELGVQGSNRSHKWRGCQAESWQSNKAFDGF